jgi:hypothetical protein
MDHTRVVPHLTGCLDVTLYVTPGVTGRLGVTLYVTPGVTGRLGVTPYVTGPPWRDALRDARRDWPPRRDGRS